MKLIRTLIALFLFAGLAACAESVTPSPTVEPTAAAEVMAATPTALPLPTDTPLPEPTEAPVATHRIYENDQFGLSFQYPVAWFGPDEVVAENYLRVAVGSDVVYPYGTSREDQIYTMPDAYYILLEYSLNEQNEYWLEVYRSLANMQDGQSVSDTRGMTIRLKEITLGRFTGYEYIATLAEGAQTEAFYAHSFILMDEASNLLRISGSPNNVQLVGGAQWREAYRLVDERYRLAFLDLLTSLTIK